MALYMLFAALVIASGDWAVLGACVALAVATMLFIFYIQPDASDLAPHRMMSSPKRAISSTPSSSAARSSWINCSSAATQSTTICGICGLSIVRESIPRVILRR